MRERSPGERYSSVCNGSLLDEWRLNQSEKGPAVAGAAVERSAVNVPVISQTQAGHWRRAVGAFEGNQRRQRTGWRQPKYRAECVCAREHVAGGCAVEIAIAASRQTGQRIASVLARKSMQCGEGAGGGQCEDCPVVTAGSAKLSGAIKISVTSFSQVSLRITAI